MSRISRMQSATRRVWTTPQSPVRIEYSADLLRQARLESASGDAGGVLFGLRDGDQVRVLAARREVDSKDPRLAGMDAVGTFAARIRGDVFLTESDLERFANLDPAGTVALVVAGDRAGFFILEADGSMQTIRSYQEFAVSGPPANLQPKVEPPKFQTRAPRARSWAWIALGCFAVIAIPVTARPYLLPLLSRVPLGLAVSEEQGQLRIRWNPVGGAQQARIEIVDGLDRTAFPVSATLSNATYMRRTPDVQVTLIVDSRREISRFVTPPALTEVERTRVEIQNLDYQARQLNSAVEAGRRTIAALQKNIANMSH